MTHLPNDKKLTPEAKNIIIGGDKDNDRNEDFETKALDFGQAAKDMLHESRKIHLRNQVQAKRIRQLENEIYDLKQQLGKTT